MENGWERGISSFRSLEASGLNFSGFGPETDRRAFRLALQFLSYTGHCRSSANTNEYASMDLADQAGQTGWTGLLGISNLNTQMSSHPRRVSLQFFFFQVLFLLSSQEKMA